MEKRLKQKKGLSLGKVAEFCGVTRKTILRWVKEDMIPSFVLPSGHHRIMPKDVAAFLRDHGMPVPEVLEAEGKPLVLVADDEEDVRKLICRILEKDYKVVEARNGIETCLQLGQNPPEILVLDIRMPKMDGIDVCREIKKDKHLSSVKILVVSAHLDEAVLGQVGETIDAYLTKPFNPQDLLHLCNTLRG